MVIGKKPFLRWRVWKVWGSSRSLFLSPWYHKKHLKNPIQETSMLIDLAAAKCTKKKTLKKSKIFSFFFTQFLLNIVHEWLETLPHRCELKVVSGQEDKSTQTSSTTTASTEPREKGNQSKMNILSSFVMPLLYGVNMDNDEVHSPPPTHFFLSFHNKMGYFKEYTESDESEAKE